MLAEKGGDATQPEGLLVAGKPQGLGFMLLWAGYVINMVRIYLLYANIILVCLCTGCWHKSKPPLE